MAGTELNTVGAQVTKRLHTTMYKNTNDFIAKTKV
jgi:hypothetical protein